ncbi:MAG: hypothetical protein MK135_13995, partial [Polyangiaceae bacterium]|nr:hypothetical protein [Polyangiaceae bacterium]
MMPNRLCNFVATIACILVSASCSSTPPAADYAPQVSSIAPDGLIETELNGRKFRGVVDLVGVDFLIYTGVFGIDEDAVMIGQMKYRFDPGMANAWAVSGLFRVVRSGSDDVYTFYTPSKGYNNAMSLSKREGTPYERFVRQTGERTLSLAESQQFKSYWGAGVKTHAQTIQVYFDSLCSTSGAAFSHHTFRPINSALCTRNNMKSGDLARVRAFHEARTQNGRHPKHSMRHWLNVRAIVVDTEAKTRVEALYGLSLDRMSKSHRESIIRTYVIAKSNMELIRSGVRGTLAVYSDVSDTPDPMTLAALQEGRATQCGVNDMLGDILYKKGIDCRADRTAADQVIAEFEAEQARITAEKATREAYQARVAEYRRLMDPGSCYCDAGGIGEDNPPELIDACKDECSDYRQQQRNAQREREYEDALARANPSSCSCSGDINQARSRAGRHTVLPFDDVCKQVCIDYAHGVVQAEARSKDPNAALKEYMNIVAQSSAETQRNLNEQYAAQNAARQKAHDERMAELRQQSEQARREQARREEQRRQQNARQKQLDEQRRQQAEAERKR